MEEKGPKAPMKGTQRKGLIRDNSLLDSDLMLKRSEVDLGRQQRRLRDGPGTNKKLMPDETDENGCASA
jgi:hypothetical protein